MPIPAPGSCVKPKPLLTRRETAQRLRVSISTVRRLGEAGAITEIRAGLRAVRIDPESVEAHLRAGRRKAAA